MEIVSGKLLATFAWICNFKSLFSKKLTIKAIQVLTKKRLTRKKSFPFIFGLNFYLMEIVGGKMET